MMKPTISSEDAEKLMQVYTKKKEYTTMENLERAWKKINYYCGCLGQ